MQRRFLQRAWPACVAAALAMGALSLPLAQAADEKSGDSGATQRPEPSLKFTPSMARSMGAMYVRHVLMKRYDLPEDKMAEAEEKVARRLMQMAHRIDQNGYELVERFMEEQLDRAAVKGGASGFMPPGFGKEFAERVLPLLPEINEMARGVVQDVRPMLPLKKQFQMAGEMMAFKTFMNGFEDTMKKWASGEVTEYEDPFRQQQTKKRNEDGETPSLEGARRQAQHAIEKPRAGAWKTYLDEFKELYQLDAAQTATAESILREYTEREQTITARQEWAQRVYQDELWIHMCYQLPRSWMHPARVLLEDDLAAAKSSIDRLEEEFKTRLETIPTRTQRVAADERIDGLLKEKGLQAVATQAQANTEAQP
jgi:hypothetical protein